MNGSPLQISWANRIKYRLSPELTDIKRHFTHSDPWTQKRVRYLANRALIEMDARWWIAAHSRGLLENLMDQEQLDLRETEVDHEVKALLDGVNEEPSSRSP